MNPWTDRKAERQKDRERADRLEDGRWWLFRWTGRDPGGSETDGQIHRQGAWREVRGRRAECPMRQEAGHEVALQVAQEKGAKRQGTGERDSKTGWPAGGLLSLSLSPQRLWDLPELQVDPIFGLQHNSLNRNGNPGGIWCQLKAEQGQGHSHLHLVHGKLLPNAVPGSGRENVRSGVKACSQLGRLWPLSAGQKQGIQGYPCGPGSTSFPGRSHWSCCPALVHTVL